MKKVKRSFKPFLFYDYTGIENHLNKMAKKGWRIHNINQFYWEYHKMEPRDLTYTVTYFSEASEFNPYPTENQRTFYEYCNNAGWSLATSQAYLQIFYTDKPDAIPIETEESIKLNTIHRAMKKTLLLSNLLLMFLAIFQLLFQFYLINNDPVSKLSNNSDLFMLLGWIGFFILLLVTLFDYAVWYFKSKKAINMGGTCITKTSTNKNLILILTMFFPIAIYLSILFNSNKLFGWIFLFSIVQVGIPLYLANTIKKALKRAGVSRQINISITIFSSLLLTLIFTASIVFTTIKAISSGWIGDKADATYTTNLPNGSSHDWDIYYDTIPLKVEDLQTVNYEHYSYKWEKSNSLLLRHSIGDQSSFPDGQDAPDLRYEIVDVKLPILYNLCLNDFLEKYDYGIDDLPWEFKTYFVKTNDPIWQADEVYQLINQKVVESEYILCLGNKIVTIRFSEIPTNDQIATTIEKLRN